MATTTRGQPITFVNEDASPLGTFNPIAPSPFYLSSVFHTVTSCASPCRSDYGISYPLSNGKVSFDSGELGVGTPGVGRIKWSTPSALRPGDLHVLLLHPPLDAGRLPHPRLSTSNIVPRPRGTI